MRGPGFLLIVDMFTSSTLTGGGGGLRGARNYVGLTDEQIERCKEIWNYLGGWPKPELDRSEARSHGSRTRYDETLHAVILGADAYPGTGLSANSRLSVVACLAHELAHAQRASMGFRRPLIPPDVHLDETETSIHASFLENVSRRDREDLVEDARDRLFDWLASPTEWYDASRSD